ncbi:hypothetical protein [Methylobacterium haplocladii]|uniref:Lipoprotein n=1 Tax=Methylobacterium haplocladii TaxID=1176176 RepID=A0A512IJY8_9HYPH|nr:hypothetical protein [Methylobacterium haplocladii]GEO98026.1 hypothetical protein MHA02_04140 [Methylobacterium haplocladii]GJD86466.1 hypothetical protein HPGCJGGD_4373 [Methylobacterium haplocladii]GLS57927.1 hypothetical protein GCM10007887_05830 [Methylobacterium haplocladii]
MPRHFLIAAMLAGFALPAVAEDAAPPRTIRNAPAPRALELAAYIYSASNVCGYKIGVPEFDAVLSKMNTKSEDVSPRGPFGARIQGIFAMMSNDMALHREQSCIAVAGEYGPEGSIAKNVLQPMAAGETLPPAPQAPDATPAK